MTPGRPLQIALESGRSALFRGEIPGTICIVPLTCLQNGFDREAYAQSGWTARNVRINRAAIGSMLFPRLDAPITAPTATVLAFLEETRAELGLTRPITIVGKLRR